MKRSNQHNVAPKEIHYFYITSLMIIYIHFGALRWSLVSTKIQVRKNSSSVWWLKIRRIDGVSRYTCQKNNPKENNTREGNIIFLVLITDNTLHIQSQWLRTKLYCKKRKKNKLFSIFDAIRVKAAAREFNSMEI